MSEERFDVISCGRTLGTSTGWDGDETIVTYYDFEPNAEAKQAGILACDCMNVDTGDGWIEAVNDKGETIWKHDLIDTLKQLPPVRRPANALS